MNDFHAYFAAAYKDGKDISALHSLHVDKDRRDGYPESKHNERRPVDEPSGTGKESQESR